VKRVVEMRRELQQIVSVEATKSKGASILYVGVR
jgi:hypothetical protein